MKVQTISEPARQRALVALRAWRRELGVSEVTVWRWRRQGWISPINISGRLYITEEDMHQFKQRAAAGEFQRKILRPERN